MKGRQLSCGEAVLLFVCLPGTRSSMKGTIRPEVMT